MDRLERRIERLEHRTGVREEPKRLEVTDPELLVMLRGMAEKMPGPAAQRFLDRPLPCSQEEYEAAQERVADRRRTEEQ